jgi:hypothetical protein
MYLMRRILIALCCALFALPALGDEGMWMPQQIPELAPRLRAMGFTGDPKSFADLTGFPMGAIVSLGGCSASFVSPEGLIVTNNHCVQGALQYNSRPDRNLMVDGFLAASRADELWAGPGSRVMVTVSVRDVTEEITGKIDPKATDRQRYDVVEKRVKERTAACETNGLRCTVSSFFEGKKWFELAQMEIRDVRLVYAPAAGIGNFGGETDNWQWPRHTGDFSFYRAYVSPAGKAAPHSKENVPFRPKEFLRVSTKGANPGELVFVAGYPGRTYRLNTYAEVRETVDFALPRVVKRYGEQIALLEKLSKEDRETALRVSTRLRGLNNTLTKDKGVLEGMLKGGLLAQKEEDEKQLVAWIDADPARKAAYADVLPALNALVAEKARTRERDALLLELSGGRGPVPYAVLGSAQAIYRFSVERAKPDANRDPAFQQRNWTRLREAQERAQRNLDPKADRVLMTYTLTDVAKLPPGQRIEAVDRAVGLTSGMGEADAAKAIASFLDRFLAGTRLYDKAFRLGCLDRSAAELVATNDTALALAAALYPLSEEIREEAKGRTGAGYRLGPRYADALLLKNGGLVAPDANSTLRVTYGQVKPVEPRDGILYLAQTTLAGIVEKATGTGEFDAPGRELEAIRALRAGKKTPYLDPKLNDVPVDFLSTVDTTGGNSGSATLNGAGELVGLLFDGTYDTVASDYLFDEEKTRSIHVDTRYMLWVMTNVDGAAALLGEMGVPAGKPPQK